MKRLYNFLLPLLLLAPDGAGGSGAAPGEISLEDWIKRLNEAEKKDWEAIVEELANAQGIKLKAAFKKLKEAGWDPGNSDTPAGPSVNTEGPAVGGVIVTLRHKSPYPYYRRAGLLLTNQWKPFEVTAEQITALKADTWIEFQKPAGPNKT